METPLYLLHMSDKVLAKFKDYISHIIDEEAATMEDQDYDPMATSVLSFLKK